MSNSNPGATMTTPTVNLTFTQQQLQVLSAALVELPYRVAGPVIADINQQIQAQTAATAADSQPMED
jgi:hypothetical protein